MSILQPKVTNHLPRVFVVVLLSCLPASAATLDGPSPLLEQISRESQALYESVRPGLVIVQLPQPKWLGALMDANSPIRKWDDKLDPEVRAKLEAELKMAGSRFVEAQVQPTTQPADGSENPLRFQILPRPDGTFDIQAARGDASPQTVSTFGPRSIGLVVDDAGHIVVPVYIDRDDVGDAPLKVYYGLGTAAPAKFVGSDRKTGLSVLKLDKTGIKPVNLSGKRPAEGSLVMVLATSGEGGQLLVWTGGIQENTIVVSCDGAIAGFSRVGQFLAGEHARPIVKQLITHGVVKRAQLGVYIRQVEGPSGKPVVGIEDVEPGSVADKAGLKRGDIILSLADQPVADVPSFAATIAMQDGQTSLQLLRNGETQTVTVELHPK